MNSSAAPAREPVSVPALREHPSKLFVETTTRCNLSCPMCLKHAGGGTGEGDLTPELFETLVPVLPHLDALFLNGIGEPLLHPRLEEFVATGRRLMPAEGRIGFQTNGQLLSGSRALSLAAAGVDRVCVSVDGITPDLFRTLRRGGELAGAERALAALTLARREAARPDLRFGIEFVAMRSNFRELPAAIRWGAARGACFVIVTHLIPFGPAQAGETLFGTCTDAALSLFHSWEVKARLAGVDLQRYFELLWKYGRTLDEQRVVNFVEAIRAEGRRRGVALDIRNLLETDWQTMREVAAVFDEAAEVAGREGVELRLPELVPRAERHCGFIEEGSAFVSHDGGVHPCHFLWHGCRSSANGRELAVRPRSFGTLQEKGLLEIWNGAEFRSFRENVLRHEYPVCSSCSLAPCDFLDGEGEAADCHVNGEPCGRCLWSSGLFHCLS